MRGWEAGELIKANREEKGGEGKGGGGMGVEAVLGSSSHTGTERQAW